MRTIFVITLLLVVWVVASLTALGSDEPSEESKEENLDGNQDYY